MVDRCNSKKNELEQQILKIRNWFASIKGQRLLSYQTSILNKALTGYLGRYCVCYGPINVSSHLGSKQHSFIYMGGESSKADIVCEEHAWPILTEGVEIVLLYHALDFSSSPHDLLREAARAVRPGGHLLIVGFNPYSLWGSYKKIGLRSLKPAYSLSRGRLLDWLKLLGFLLENQWSGGYYPPVKRSYFDKFFSKLEIKGQVRQWCCGGFYVVSARKMMLPLIPLEENKQRSFGKFVPIPVINRGDLKTHDRKS